MDRARVARCPGGGADRCDRVLATGPGAPDGSLPGRRPVRLAGCAWGLVRPGPAVGRQSGQRWGLREIARGRGQTLAQMAIAWTPRDPRVASTVVGSSSVVSGELRVRGVAGPHLVLSKTRDSDTRIGLRLCRRSVHAPGADRIDRDLGWRVQDAGRKARRDGLARSWDRRGNHFRHRAIRGGPRRRRRSPVQR